MDVPNKTATLQSDCTTDQTIHVLNGWTFNGSGYTITGVDPAGDHFRGAVIQGDAGADQVVIENLGVTVGSLTNACDGDADRLRGILFDGTGGVIRGNEVLGINQGESGCQEGNGIEVRNAPFTKAGPDKAVTIRDNVVDDYQKRDPRERFRLRGDQGQPGDWRWRDRYRWALEPPRGCPATM